MRRIPPPSETGEKDPLAKVLEQILQFTNNASRSEEEQKVQHEHNSTKAHLTDFVGSSKRLKEFSTKFRASVQKNLGDRAKDMYILGSLATAPAKQGHGYASTLVRLVTDTVGMQSSVVSPSLTRRTQRRGRRAVLCGLAQAMSPRILASITLWGSRP